MTTHTGNSSVQSGYYLNTRSFAIEVVPEGGGTLPGAATAKYVSVPFPALFLVVPVVGLAFLMFLPAIGFALFAQALVMKVTGHVAEGASSLAASVAPDLAPGAAYLAGHKDEEKKDAPVTPEIEKLEGEIKAKRGE
ncbi:MAG: hypothetical protein IPQ24_19885 [Anaeromyxobacter sp.]|nr:hypothetical protein [Anaeromyxobacter sp.]